MRRRRRSTASSARSSAWAARPTCRAGKFRTVIGAVGEEGQIDQSHLAVAGRRREGRPDHEAVQARQPRVPRGRQRRRGRRRERAEGEDRRHATPCCIAGPCAVENEKMLHTIARHVRDGGATILRGGAFKPRTSPYSFQGHGETGAEVDARVRRRAGHADLHRGDGHPAGRADRAVHRHASRSAPGTCRTSTCSARSARRASRSCSSAGWRRR